MRNNADTEMYLSETIRRRRLELKLTQEDLSDISGVSLRLIHELEHGKEGVRLSNIIKILASLGLHLELTLGASDKVTINPALTRTKK